MGSVKKIVILALILAFCLGIYVISDIVKNIKRSNEVYGQPFFFPTYPTPNTARKSPQTVALIKRGEYLVTVGDCIACHTDAKKDSPAFAGGLAMQTPFGVIYSPNITPDKKTGIGNWTQAQFDKAMHEGIGPHGEYYYPAFPYLY